MNLLKFWQECRARRAQQLLKFEATWDILKAALGEGDGVLQGLVWEHEKWLKEAREKLAHAEAMVLFFQAIT